MRSAPSSLLLLVLLLLPCSSGSASRKQAPVSSGSASRKQAPATPSKPNIILLLGEGQGWGSMSAALDDRNPAGSRSDFILTPNLDRLAASGVRFSDFYISSPRCTPSRVTFFTGRNPAQLHITFVNEGRNGNTTMPGDKVIPPISREELPATVPTLAEVLRRSGYVTAHFGKWHVGRVSPHQHGFDETDGPNNNGGPEEVDSPNPKQAYAIARQGIDFMTRQSQAGKPFFLQISEYPGRGNRPTDVAQPDTVTAVTKRLGAGGRGKRLTVAAGDEEVDRSLGQILERVKELGLSKNTYIFYSADHGEQGRNANGMLTGGKGTVSEGGLRVPLLVAGPGIVPNRFTHLRACSADLFPTIAELAGVKANELPRDLEGGSLVPLLKQNTKAPKEPVVHRPHEEMVIHFPHYDFDPNGPASAILLGKYKLIRYYESEERHLFDLDADIREQHDLAKSQPETVAMLDKRLTDYLTRVGADLPKPNPDYVPNGPRSIDRRSQPRRSQPRR